ncbi:hypothetical protein ORJ00_16645 [Rheinheimera baltica]|uniref:hypothetical protein n=1 Tax=Rheinheimera baltica TaxID=67576 RepID=UPI00273FD689|nr:hypothetical protein [Rheinheimera baltica]MDP5144380.1 hypothetical protein [Rheinheimera baltica]MDP5151810.1 hypothetical protein [Rheinheimera baltica]
MVFCRSKSSCQWRLPTPSLLAGHTLEESGLINTAGLIVIALTRCNEIFSLRSRLARLTDSEHLIVMNPVQLKPVDAANTLVMGPGGYRFIDYLKVGGPLSLLLFIITMLLLPLFWPLTPA